MTAQPGWYDAGVPGRERWWDGTQWTAHERLIAPPTPAAPLHPPVQAQHPPQQAHQAGQAGQAPAQQAWAGQAFAGQPTAAAASAPMGWYQVPGEGDVRWWDGASWTPYRLRDGRPKADAFAVEPPATALVLGILFMLVGVMQLGTAAIGDSGSFRTTGVLFLIVGAVWLIGSMQSSSVRKKPAPQSGAMWPDAVRPLPGEAEGPGAGWYPVAGQVTRWWTGTRWSWYIGQKYGVRPGHAGPRGYLVSMVLGWVMAGLGLIALIGGAIGAAVLSGPMVLIGAGAIVLGVLLLLLGGLILLITHLRRHTMILPTKAPPLR